MFSKCFGAIVAMISFAPLAVAHPGHGQPNAAHYVVEPTHQLQSMAFMIAIVVVAGMIALSFSRKKISS